MTEFNLGEFIKGTLIESVENGMFSNERANEIAESYSLQGVIASSDVADVAGAHLKELTEPIGDDEPDE